ncbi:hypothetical protein LX15_002487 [Streptoalloteichus tenebrarius]|uniref:Uncharacterized protein n=1 Tax=Streptoalloteichus tenebrarius (strain ATCC 17920 / DSM 40477 / JCM 4838 / CBS 697.72 / NBRC 16177 / NCIMB 11028 / NRRL B-12390 / A12253. 1 / ISP 5477) TaxID=1933 RepID=A0ABT1HTF1_STRSD|nr:hypothetical protein [Streptoalloteichus tenebrarius]BFE99533.1 hypothetical protein GCM10020241_12090 [Streptoalloteichus tenebrarius]
MGGADAFTGNPIPAKPFPFKISRRDSEVFQLNLTRAAPCDCSFALELDWVLHGQRGSTRIENQGKPFRVLVGADTLPHYRWDPASSRWTRR